jgi:spermidine/putrescine transport system permease protein
MSDLLSPIVRKDPMDVTIPNWLSRKFRRPVGWLLAPSLIILIVFFVLPTLVFLGYSFLLSGEYKVEWVFTLGNYLRVFRTFFYWDAILNSLLVGLSVAFVTTLVSYPFAYFLTYRITKGRNIVLFLVVISLLGSYLVRVYAWRTILGREGVLNSLLIGLGIIREPLLFLLFSRLAVIVTLVHVFLPFSILPILSSLQNVPYELIEAARDLGCSPFRAFLRVTLPLSITGVLAGFTYTFILAAADYITPQLVGGTSIAMIGPSISAQFIKYGNLGLGSALSFAFLVVLLLMIYLVQWLSGRLFPSAT